MEDGPDSGSSKVVKVRTKSSRAKTCLLFPETSRDRTTETSASFAAARVPVSRGRKDDADARGS